MEKGRPKEAGAFCNLPPESTFSSGLMADPAMSYTKSSLVSNCFTSSIPLACPGSNWNRFRAASQAQFTVSLCMFVRCAAYLAEFRYSICRLKVNMNHR